jgi:transglutaminase-like putative cysteine protease
MSARRAVARQIRPTLAAAGAVALTAIALSPTLADGPWVFATFLVIVTTAVIGGGARALALPGWVVMALQAVGLVLLLTWLYASDVARFGVLPDPDVWRAFGALVRDGSSVIEQEVAPVTVTDGVGFLVVSGVALVAWAVDAIAVTSRRATLAGVPLLALYLVPATVLPDGVPWPLFVAAGVGWLILLLEDGRLELSRWGRPIEGDGDGTIHSIGGTGRRLGAAALTVAVIIPVILPSLDDGRFGGGSGDGSGASGGTGDSSATERRVITVNPLVDLQRDLTRAEDSEVLAYTTDAETPQYLRIATLDQFNGDTWTLEELQAGSDQQASRGLPPPPGLSEDVARSEATYDFAIGALDTPRLPLPYPATVVDIEGDWRWDEQSFDVFSPAEDGSAFNQSYRATVLEIAPTTEQLRAAPPADPSLNPLLQLPDDVDTRLSPLAATVTGEAATDYDRALALQNWFRTEFDYNLDTVSGNRSEALERFLRSRSGYCEQFAATMALMARTLGIPSRVQVGFTPGENVEGDTWLVTVHDAHAWPELWFEGVGWVRFEPTPGGGDGGGTPAYAPVPGVDPADQAGSGNGQQDRGVVLRRGGADINNRGGRPGDLTDVLEANRGRGAFSSQTSTTQTPESGTSTAWLWLLLIGVAAAMAAAPKVASRTVRRKRWAGIETTDRAVTAAWADVLDCATDVDLRAAPTETPRDLAARLPARGRLNTEQARNLRQLAAWVELLRYRDAIGSTASVSEIRHMADGIRDDLLRGLSTRDRRLAVWWPASGRIAVIEAWNAGLEFVASSWARLVARINRKPLRSH